VIVNVDGVPEGTGAHRGMTTSAAPGPAAATRYAPIVLTFKADGYLPQSRTSRRSHQKLVVRQKKPVSTPVKRPEGRHHRSLRKKMKLGLVRRWW
jgi:hypothetical protein